MASEVAIALANKHKTVPWEIFHTSSFDGSTDQLLSILKKRTCSAFELIEVGVKQSEFQKELELEMEAFDYWVSKNLPLIEFWESKNSDIKDFFRWCAAKASRARVESILQDNKLIFEELKKTMIRFG